MIINHVGNLKLLVYSCLIVQVSVTLSLLLSPKVCTNYVALTMGLYGLNMLDIIFFKVIFPTTIIAIKYNIKTSI